LKRLFPTLATLLALAPPALAQGLELPQALQTLPRTLDWKSADLNYESAVRQLEAAQAALGFKLSGGADYSLRESSGSNLILSSTASIGLLPWSSSADAVRSAERALEQAALTRRDARNNLWITLHTQYFNLRQAQADLAVAQATLALRERQLQIVSAQNQAGAATLSELLAAQQNLDTARSGLVSAQGALELARLSLSNTLGLNPQQLGSPSTPPEEPSLPAESLEALLQRALERRSDVLRALLQLREAEENLASAERDPLDSQRLGERRLQQQRQLAFSGAELQKRRGLGLGGGAPGAGYRRFAGPGLQPGAIAKRAPLRPRERQPHPHRPYRSTSRPAGPGNHPQGRRAGCAAEVPGPADRQSRHCRSPSRPKRRQPEPAHGPGPAPGRNRHRFGCAVGPTGPAPGPAQPRGRPHPGPTGRPGLAKSPGHQPYRKSWRK